MPCRAVEPLRVLEPKTYEHSRVLLSRNRCPRYQTVHHCLGTVLSFGNNLLVSLVLSSITILSLGHYPLVTLYPGRRISTVTFLRVWVCLSPYRASYSGTSGMREGEYWSSPFDNGSLLGASWGVLGCSWEALGNILEQSWDILGPERDLGSIL